MNPIHRIAMMTLTLGIVLLAACDPFFCEGRGELAIQDIAMADARLDQAYDQKIEIIEEESGGPFGAILGLELAETSDPLPPGLQLERDTDSNDFHLRGTPTAAGAYSFVLHITEPGTQCAGRVGDFTVLVDVLE